MKSRRTVRTLCTKNNDIKICNNCKYFRNYGVFSYESKCAHISSQKINLVNGHVTYKHASINREFGECSKNGIHHVEEENYLIRFYNNPTISVAYLCLIYVIGVLATNK